MPDTPLSLARQVCDTMLRRYPAAELPPVGHFHYHQGVFLSGMLKTWALCGDERYFAYAQDWMRAVLDKDGGIRQYDHADLDDIQPGILLYPLWDRTGDPLYRKAMDAVLAQVPDVPRCQCGGFYHKVRCTGQMWLDGLYMACPFIAEYGRRFARPDLQELAVQEILLMREHTRDAATGLWCHAWDETKQAKWADPETGCSATFWGRAMGWVPVAVLDALEQLPASHPQRGELQALVADLLQSLCRYQGPDGRWWQVVDKVNAPGNWPENSCSSLYTAALCRAMRCGILGPEYEPIAAKAFDGVAASLGHDSGDLLIGNVCIGTGVGNGDYEYYCARPVSVNDLHGVGAFLLMCAERQRWLDGRK